MCGGTKVPEDKSADVAAIQAKSEADARAEAAKQEAAKQAAFDQQMNSAFGTGIQSADDYFTQRGLDPKEYESAITSRANQVRSGVPNLAANPGSYFEGLGSQVFDQLQTGLRGTATRGIDKLAPTGFASTRIADTADDDTLAAILGDQEGKAKDYANNLKARGVVTDSGFKAAMDAILGQEAGARGKLTEIGNGILNTGRGDAENLANAARTRAGALNLGDQFDPNDTGKQLNDFFTSFFGGLGDKVRGAAPASLFDTSGLANIAGAAQGAGNTRFDPAAVAGDFTNPEDDPNNPVQTTNPF